MFVHVDGSSGSPLPGSRSLPACWREDVPLWRRRFGAAAPRRVLDQIGAGA